MQDVQAPGVNKTRDEGAQVEPTCPVKRSMVSYPSLNEYGVKCSPQTDYLSRSAFLIAREMVATLALGSRIQKPGWIPSPGSPSFADRSEGSLGSSVDA